MALTVKIGDDQETTHDAVKVELNIRKTLDGNLMIFDHPEVDIVIKPANNKIIVFPKDRLSDKVYDVQDRFFHFLASKGVVDRGRIHAGAVYGSMEAQFPNMEESSAIQNVLNVISKFIGDEQDYFNAASRFEKEFEESLTEPDDEESTELGEVPHASQKGSIRPGYIYHPYGISSLYRYE